MILHSHSFKMSYNNKVGSSLRREDRKRENVIKMDQIKESCYYIFFKCILINIPQTVGIIAQGHLALGPL